ncbi:MAG TPA: hypothetical protein VFI65_32860, partial [Streptosporangiaceae bacterium]|nr:hypothetical protein [Streptosporangiaceae bacterium]
DPPGAWHRKALLWRSALTEPVWTELAFALSVRHRRDGIRRDLEVRLAADPPEPREPVDPYWLYVSPASQSDGETVHWSRPYWDQISHKMDVCCGTNDSVILHALEPVLDHIGATVATFLRDDGASSSAAHDLVSLWLSSTLGTNADLRGLYRRCLDHLQGQSTWDDQTQHRVKTLILSCLRSDADRLPPEDVAALTRILG